MNRSAREGLFDGGHGEEELVGVIRERDEFMVTIERAAGLAQSFDYDADGCYLRCVSLASVQNVHQEETPEVLAPVPAANGQPAEQGSRKKWIAGKASCNGFRQLAEMDAVRREGIVADDHAVAADQSIPPVTK